MNRTLRYILLHPISLCTLLLWGLTSCNDAYSNLGGSLRPEQDIVTARGDSISFQVETVTLDSVYSRSAVALLGQISDPTYGDLRASYISRLQCAPGFTFTHNVLKDRIDSVTIELAYLRAVGDTTTWSKLRVYEITQELPNRRYSTSELSPYTKGAKLLGELTYQPSDTTGAKGLSVRVPNELGVRFFNASREHPEWFTSQEAFEEHLMRGIYVTSTTGTGHILSIYATALRIFYTFETTEKTSKGADSTVYKPAWEIFSSNKNLYTLQCIQQSYLADLLKPAIDGKTYIKSPAGVVTKLTCTKEELSKLLHAYETISDKENFGWVMNEAKLKVTAGTPNVATHLNPPSQLLLIPEDSVKNFFANSITDPTLASEAFVSGTYSVLERSYTFNNISTLLEYHMRHNMGTDTKGSHRVTKDLKLLLIPVSLEKTTTSNGSTAQTVAIANLMQPSAVQLKWGAKSFKLGVIGTGFYDKKERKGN